MAFQPGREKTGGRRGGARHKLSTDFLESFAADFAQHGAAVIKVARVERPIEYLKIVAGILPKELEICDSRLKDLTDEEIDALITQLKQQLSTPPVGDAARREDEALH